MASTTPTTESRARTIDEVLDLMAEALLKDAQKQNGSNPTGVEPKTPEE